MSNVVPLVIAYRAALWTLSELSNRAFAHSIHLKLVRILSFEFAPASDMYVALQCIQLFPSADQVIKNWTVLS